MTDCKNEFPKNWFTGVKLYKGESPSGNRELNFFKVIASQPLSVWKKRGWIHPQDPRGWFQWYCRYYMGRRSGDDLRQIKRWKAMVRHRAQIKKNCMPGDLNCHRKQRQALLQWAYDSINLWVTYVLMRRLLRFWSGAQVARSLPLFTSGPESAIHVWFRSKRISSMAIKIAYPLLFQATS